MWRDLGRAEAEVCEGQDEENADEKRRTGETVIQGLERNSKLIK